MTLRGFNFKDLHCNCNCVWILVWPVAVCESKLQKSSGHRQVLSCSTAKCAAVAVYYHIYKQCTFKMVGTRLYYTGLYSKFGALVQIDDQVRATNEDSIDLN